MAKVICSLPNASECISGVKFAANEDGQMVSEEVSAEMAEAFAEVPGFSVVGAAKATAKASKKEPVAPAAGESFSAE